MGEFIRHFDLDGAKVALQVASMRVHAMQIARGDDLRMPNWVLKDRETAAVPQGCTARIPKNRGDAEFWHDTVILPETMEYLRQARGVLHKHYQD
jgi:hypothetical protein